MPKLVHLDEKARLTLSLPPRDRLVALNRPQATYKSGSFQLVTDRLELMYATGRYRDPAYMLLQGYVGSGKSTLLRSFHDRMNDSAPDDGEHAQQPIVYATMPSEPTVMKLIHELLRAIRYPFEVRGTSTELQSILLRKLDSLNSQMIILDEIQAINLTRASRITTSILDFIRFFGSVTDIPFVCAGPIDTAQLVLEEDAALSRRFGEPYELELFIEDDEVREILGAIEPTIGLKNAASLTSKEIVRSVQKYSNGTLDSIEKLVRGAAREAIEDGTEQITKQTFENLDWTPRALSSGRRGGIPS